MLKWNCMDLDCLNDAGMELYGFRLFEWCWNMDWDGLNDVGMEFYGFKILMTMKMEQVLVSGLN